MICKSQKFFYVVWWPWKKLNLGHWLWPFFFVVSTDSTDLHVVKRETVGSVSGYCVIWAPQQSIGQLYWWILSQHMGGHIGLHSTCRVDYKLTCQPTISQYVSWHQLAQCLSICWLICCPIVDRQLTDISADSVGRSVCWELADISINRPPTFGPIYFTNTWLILHLQSAFLSQ